MTRLDNLASLFSTTVRIKDGHPLDDGAIWPANVEICITRVPVRKRDGWDAEKFKTFALKLKNSMVKNGIVYLICYAPMEAKWRPFEIAKIMVDCGFHHIDNIVIQKSWFPGKRSEMNLVNSHEYVLHFSNGEVWKLDRTPLFEYMKIHNDQSCPGNTWHVQTGSLEEAYPVDLAELLIRMASALPGSIVFDPFGGGTGSLRSALKLGHSFYSFESDQRNIKKCKKIIDDFNKGVLFEQEEDIFINRRKILNDID